MPKVGKIISGKVEKIFPTYLLVSTKEGYEGLIHIASVSDYFVSNIGSIFKVGETYDFEILEIDEAKKWLKLSWKTIVPRFQKNPFEYTIEQTPKGFEKLRKKTEEEVNND